MAEKKEPLFDSAEARKIAADELVEKVLNAAERKGHKAVRATDGAAAYIERRGKPGSAPVRESTVRVIARRECGVELRPEPSDHLPALKPPLLRWVSRDDRTVGDDEPREVFAVARVAPPVAHPDPVGSGYQFTFSGPAPEGPLETVVFASIERAWDALDATT